MQNPCTQIVIWVPLVKHKISETNYQISLERTRETLSHSHFSTQIRLSNNQFVRNICRYIPNMIVSTKLRPLEGERALTWKVFWWPYQQSVDNKITSPMFHIKLEAEEKLQANTYQSYNTLHKSNMMHKKNVQERKKPRNTKQG